MVERSLTRIECELKEAKGDIECLKQEVALREEKTNHVKFCWEDETVRLTKVRRSTHTHTHTHRTKAHIAIQLVSK